MWVLQGVLGAPRLAHSACRRVAVGDVVGGPVPIVEHGIPAGENLLPPVATGAVHLAAAQSKLPGGLQVVLGLEVPLLRRAPLSAGRQG